MNTNLKILLIMPFFYPHKGGSQKYAEEIYSKMMGTHPNVTVDVVTYNTDNVEIFEKYRGFNIYRVPCFNVIPSRFALPNPIALTKLLKIVAQNKYDYVNTHIRFFDPTWWVWWYARKVHAKSLFTGHVATHPVYQNKLVEIVAKAVDLTIAKWSVQKYDLITYVSKTTQKFFEKVLNVEKPSTIIYGSIDTEYFHPRSKSNRLIPKIDTKVDDDEILITFVGRLIWTKGITYLYQAIKELQTENSIENIKFILGGPGELEKALTKNIKKDNLSDNVFITGNLAYEQVRDLLAVSDIYINPSHHSEGFPLTILEAGASGCYVIATDNAGTREVIEDNKTGKLIPQRDTEAIKESILWAINNENKRKECAQILRIKIINEFDIRITSEELYNLLKDNNTK